MDRHIVRNTTLSTLVVIAVIALTGSSFAGLAGAARTSPPLRDPVDLDQVYHDENQVELLITNIGMIGQNPLNGSAAGFWPTGSGNSYIFGSGIWVGGIADVDGDGTPDTVAVMGYDPSNGETEFGEGRVGQSTSDPLARVFDSRDSTDIAEWPDEFRDQFGEPRVLSQQDLVTIYNDLNGQPLGARRLAIQVNQRSMAFSGKVAGTSVHAIYFVWTVVNRSDSVPDGPYTIEDLYLGFINDADVGDVPNASDDMTSFIPSIAEDGDTTVLNAAVAWDQALSEVGYDAVGLVGFMFDESLLPDGDVNYTFMSNPGIPQPRPDPEPSDDTEVYEILACLDDQCQELDIATDIRFLLSLGPVDLAPGEIQRYRGVLFFAYPFADPSSLEVAGDPPRIDPYQEGLANFIQVAKEVKLGLSVGGFPSPFDLFRASLHADVADTTGPYTIHTGITDSSGLKEATLRYSVDGGASYTPVAMSPSIFLDYSGNIPGQPGETTVLYYVEATDSADVVLTDPATAPDSVYSFLVMTPSSIDDEPFGSGIPRAVALGQNYPNPFNPMTVITFEVPEGSRNSRRAVLEVFDTRGRMVRRLFDGEVRAGSHEVVWNGTTDTGGKAGSGIYLYRLTVAGETVSRKMVLLK
jgi:hypothetical protein